MSWITVTTESKFPKRRLVSSTARPSPFFSAGRVLARQAAAQGRPVEAVAAALLESAANPTSAGELTQPERRTGQALIDAFAEIRGLLTNQEIDRMFTRNPSGASPVDLS